MEKRKITYEHLLIGAVFILALLVRFIHLGQPPLNDYEAAPALQALNIASGKEAMIGDQPAYVMLTAGLFRLFDATDFGARLWPALAGACIVFLPFLFRKYLSDRTALLTSAFLAIDPALVAVSRTASAESLAVLGLIAGLGFLLKKKAIPAGIFLGIALSTGPSFWVGSLIFLLVWLTGTYLLHMRFFEGVGPREVGTTAVTAAVTAVFLTTGFMFVPNGITGIGNGLVSFVNAWQQSSLLSIKTALILFAATYFPLLLLAGFGFFISLKKQHSFSLLLLSWFLAGTLVVILMTGRQVAYWTWAAIPLWVLSALTVEEVSRRAAGSERVVLRAEIVLTISLLIFSFLNLLAYFFNSYGDSVVDRNRLIGTVLPVILLLLVTAFLAWGWSPRSAFSGLVIGIGGLLFFLLLSASMKSAGSLIQASAIGWKPQSITVGSELLTSQIEDLSFWNHGQRYAIDIDVVALDVPSLRWALRNFDKVSWDSQYSQAETPSVIIAPDYQQIGATTLYRGQGISWGQYPSYTQMKFTDWVKWIFYRQAPVDELRLILYARNDLFKQ